MTIISLFSSYVFNWGEQKHFFWELQTAQLEAQELA